jgi:hypothetical protein
MSTGFNARVVLRPRALDETFDLAVAYARRHWRDFWRIQLALIGGALAIIAAVKVLASLDWLETWALVMVLATPLELMITVYAGNHLFGIPTSLKSSAAAVLRHPLLLLGLALIVPAPWLAMLLTHFQQQALTALMLVLDLLGWSFLLARLAYLPQVVLLESSRSQSAGKRSKDMIVRRFGRALLLVIASAALLVGFTLGFELWSRFVISEMLQLGEPIDTLFDNLGSWPSVAGFLFASPFLALARLFDYVDARTRLDGWDIQVRMKAIAAKEQAALEKGIAA